MDKEFANELKRKELTFLATASGLPQSRWKTDKLVPSKEDLNKFIELQEIRDNILEFINNGRNLFICSKSSGTGKTTWSIKLMTSYFKEIWAGNGFEPRALFIHVPTLLYRLKDFNNPLDIEQIKEIDLVIFDDIATQDKLTPFEYNQLLMIIDYRLLSKKSCIFTSNLTTIVDLEKSLGARLASRVYCSSKIVEFTGKDMRGLQ